MKLLRENITQQVEQKEQGKLFTLDDLKFDPQRRSRVVAVLSELAHNQLIVRATRGVYFRPKPSRLGLPYRTLDYKERLDFICKQLNGYLSGAYTFNKMQLTEQVPQVVTIACPKPVRAFEKMNIRLDCIKSYVKDLEGINPHHLRILDAIRCIEQVPGAKPEKVYARLIQYHFKQLAPEELEDIIRLSMYYPPRVRRVLADICEDLAYKEGQQLLTNTFDTNTRFKQTSYRNFYGTTQRQ